MKGVSLILNPNFVEDLQGKSQQSKYEYLYWNWHCVLFYKHMFYHSNYQIKNKTDARIIYTYMKLVDIAKNCRNLKLNPDCSKAYSDDNRWGKMKPLRNTKKHISRTALAQPFSFRHSTRFALIGLSLSWLIPNLRSGVTRSTCIACGWYTLTFLQPINPNGVPLACPSHINFFRGT